eukprot:scaffold6045_cov188-Prasinococcus_capsulatus_cf.AAC.3
MPTPPWKRSSRVFIGFSPSAHCAFCRSSALSRTNSVPLSRVHGSDRSRPASSLSSSWAPLPPRSCSSTFSSSSSVCNTRTRAARSEFTLRKPSHTAWVVASLSKAMPATASAAEVLPTPGSPCST